MSRDFDENQDRMSVSFAKDINPCPPCDCGGITRLTAKVMERGDYHALYEKEKAKWEKLKNWLNGFEHHVMENSKETVYWDYIDNILEKMQGLEAE